MQRTSIFFSDTQLTFLREQSERTGLAAAELLRRMVDHCSQSMVFYSLVPHCSGCLTNVTQ